MAGRHQKAAVIANPPIGWQMQFTPVENSRKVMCLACGTMGYTSTSMRPSGWQASCLLGHPEECSTCGGRFVKGGLKQHLRCISGHTRCPDHGNTQSRRLRGLQRALA